MAESERRKHIRRKLRYPAWVAVQPEKYVDCEVLDISESGAKIKIKLSSIAPDHFILAFNLRGIPNRSCRVVWRKEEHLGLQFAIAGRDIQRSRTICNLDKIFFD